MKSSHLTGLPCFSKQRFEFKLSWIPSRSAGAYELCDHLLCTWLPLLLIYICPFSAAALQPNCWGQEDLCKTHAGTHTFYFFYFTVQHMSKASMLHSTQRSNNCLVRTTEKLTGRGRTGSGNSRNSRSNRSSRHRGMLGRSCY